MGKTNDSADRRKRRQREKEFRKNYARSRRESQAQSAHEHSLWRRRLPYVLITIGGIVGLAHLAAHADIVGIRPTALQDLVVGYPTALGLAVIGAILLPAQRS